LLLWSFLYSVASRISDGENYKGVPIILSCLVVLFFLFLYALSRKGYFILASYLLIFLYFLTISYACFHWGTNLPTALLSFSLIIIMASILISTRFAFILSCSIAAVVIALAYLENRGVIHPARYWLIKRIYTSDGIGYAIILFLIAVVSWLSNREIEGSLRRARLSESALKEERDLLEIKVEQRTRELQEAQSEKITQLYRFAEFGKLASGLFHDLMNPLTSISLYLEHMNKANPAEVAETQNYLKKAFEASKRIDRFSQAVRKQLQHREARELFSVTEGVRQAIQLVAHKAWQEGIKINYEPTQEIETFDNPLKFHQVVVNLISNAIDSYADIPKDHRRKSEIALTLERRGLGINLTIQDWGSGISDEAREKIFQPFYTTKTSGKGIGIGLSTTKEIIEKDFGGKIEMESVSGQGTIFRISFPWREDVAKDARQSI